MAAPIELRASLFDLRAAGEQMAQLSRADCVETPVDALRCYLTFAALN
jgi:hypothetical protein